MNRGQAHRHPSLTRLDRRSTKRPVGIHDVLGALVDHLAEAFELGEREHTLAYLVLFGRKAHDVARALQCSEVQAQAELAALLERTDTRSREDLFHLALRLANTPGAWRSAPLTPPAPPRVTTHSRGWNGAAAPSAARAVQTGWRM